MREYLNKDITEIVPELTKLIRVSYDDPPETSELVSYKIPMGDEPPEACYDALKTMIIQDTITLFNEHLEFNQHIESDAELNYSNLLSGIMAIKIKRRSDNGRPLRYYGKKTLVVSEKNRNLANAEIAFPDKTPEDSNILPEDFELIIFPDEYFMENIDSWFIIETPYNWIENSIAYYISEQPLYVEDDNLVFEYATSGEYYLGVFGSNPSTKKIESKE